MIILPLSSLSSPFIARVQDSFGRLKTLSWTAETLYVDFLNSN
jgi:hypothetical protein